MNKNFIIGSLLGDGFLEKGTRNKNARFKIRQSYNHLSYLEYCFNCLGNMSSGSIKISEQRKPSKDKQGKISHSLELWNGEMCKSGLVYSKSCEEFTELWNVWYSTSGKTIPRTLVLNPEIIAHWYIQDGQNNVSKSSKGVVFSTHSFSKNDCDFLCDQLNNMNLESKIYDGPIIRIMAGSYFDFIEIVKPFFSRFSCFDYKIDTSKAPKDRTGEKWNGPKLNLEIAKTIRSLKKENTLFELAKLFNTSVSTISKIVNHKMYVESNDLNISGTADVKIGYKYGY